MTEEEAKKHCRYFIDNDTRYSRKMNEAVETILNLVKKQQEELKIFDITSKCNVELIEELRATVKKQQEEIEKKDKIIDFLERLSRRKE